jgi:hypothetical protein
MLDDAANRLAHNKNVLRSEIQRAATRESSSKVEVESTCGCCCCGDDDDDDDIQS